MVLLDPVADGGRVKAKDVATTVVRMTIVYWNLNMVMVSMSIVCFLNRRITKKVCTSSFLFLRSYLASYI